MRRTAEQIAWGNAAKKLAKLRKARSRAEPNARKFILNTAKQRARKYRMKFNLTLEDIQIPAVCPVLGIPIALDGPTAHKPSIDRIHNHKGYVRGNIVVISYRANRLKSDASIDELQALAKFYSSIT